MSETVRSGWEKNPLAANAPESHTRVPTCCASLIMSPFVLDRNVPLIRPLKGGQIGADRDESGGIAKGGSAGASAQWAAAGHRCEPAAARQLSPSQAVVEALSRGRCGRFGAPQRGARFQPRL